MGFYLKHEGHKTYTPLTNYFYNMNNKEEVGQQSFLKGLLRYQIDEDICKWMIKFCQEMVLRNFTVIFPQMLILDP